MSWTYDETLLSEPLNHVRLLIGDTNANRPLLQDEEIDLFLQESDSPLAAARRAAGALAARAAQEVDKWVGDLKILASQRHRHYTLLEESLAKQAFRHAVPSAGGIRVSDKESMTGNDDLVSPYFFRGMHDNPGVDE